MALMPGTSGSDVVPPVSTRPPVGGMGGSSNNTLAPRRPNRPALPTGAGQLYGGYTEQQLLANPALVSHLGSPAAAKWAAAHPGGTGGTGAPTPAPAPAAPTPAPNPFTPGPGTGAPPTSAPVGPPMPTAPYPGAASGGPNDLSDPMNLFLSTIPAMRLNSQQQIGDAMANAGFTGNRWGSSAMRTAGQIGAEEGMSENALLQKTLSDYANQQANRALQADQQGAQLGGLYDQLAQSRLQLPFQIGQYEQGRQDDLSKLLFQQWDQNKLGWLGPFLQAASSQGAGSPGTPGQIYTTTTPGSPGAADWATLLANLFK